MKIYTKTGDNQTTSIGSSRVGKDHIVVEVNGTVDELSSSLMICYYQVDDEEIKEYIKQICTNLMHMSFEIITKKEYISETNVKRLEDLIDYYDAKLPKLKNFILPGSSLASAHFHFSRTICRRLERRVVTLTKEYEVSKFILHYLNRLSDLLFVWGRYVGDEKNDA